MCVCDLNWQSNDFVLLGGCRLKGKDGATECDGEKEVSRDQLFMAVRRRSRNPLRNPQSNDLPYVK